MVTCVLNNLKFSLILLRANHFWKIFLILRIKMMYPPRLSLVTIGFSLQLANQHDLNTLGKNLHPFVIDGFTIGLLYLRNFI